MLNFNQFSLLLSCKLTCLDKTVQNKTEPAKKPKEQNLPTEKNPQTK